jgi:replicative DNA helicase
MPKQQHCELPNSDEVEVSVLGAMLLSNSAIERVVGMLETPEWRASIAINKCGCEVFYNPKHRLIYEAILQLWNAPNRVSPDIISLSEKMRSDGTLEDAGGTFYISEINRRTPTYAHISNHVRLLLEYHIRRCLIAISAEIISASYDIEHNALDELLTAQSDLQTLQNAITQHTIPQGKIDDVLIERLETAQKLSICPSGYVVLDKFLNGGFRSGQLVLIGARPSIGKSALAACMALNMMQQGHKVLFFTLEMPAEDVFLRMASISSGNSLSTLQTRPNTIKNTLPESYFAMLRERLILDDTTYLDERMLTARTESAARKHGVDVVFVDYLGKLSCSIGHDNEYEQLRVISAALKNLALSQKIPVIALVQLNRAVEATAKQIPSMANIRGSGHLEQDADIIIFPHRQMVEIADENGELYESRDNKTSLIIDKNRSGRTGFLQNALNFEPRLVRFTDNFGNNPQYNDQKIATIEQEDIAF